MVMKLRRLLEFTWIKEFNPRFNVMFKDDKSYPYLAVEYGGAFLASKSPEKRAGKHCYFGPFTKV